MGAHTSLSSFIIGLPAFMDKLGYEVPPDLPQSFFRMYGEHGDLADLDAPSFEALEAILCPMCAKTKDQQETFPTDYRHYILDMAPTGMGDKDEKDGKEAKEQLERNKREIDRLERMLEQQKGQLAWKQEAISARERSIDDKRRRAAEIEAGKRASEARIEALEREDEQRKKAEEGKRKKKGEQAVDKVKGQAGGFRDDISKLLDNIQDCGAILDYLGTVGEGRQPAARETERMREIAPALMRAAMLDTKNKKKRKELIDFASALSKLADRMGRSAGKVELAPLEKERLKLEELSREGEANRSRIETDIKELEDDKKALDIARRDHERASRDASEKRYELIRKNESLRNRERFLGGRSAAQSLSKGSPAFGVRFGDLTDDEKGQIRKFIRDNARAFRTRMARNITTGSHRELDIPATCKRACVSGGVPMDLRYRKPMRSRTRLVMILDISGSCRAASEMMLTFMHEMKEVFPGGCRTYAFAGHLHDVTDIFRESLGPQESIAAIHGAVPTRGVYSDYGLMLSDFYGTEMPRLTKDSMVFFMGDARNNRNESGERYIREITRRAKRSFWIETEPREKWDTGDSILSTYARYMDRVAEVLDTGQLLEFITSVKG